MYISAVYVFCSATRLFIDGGNHEIQDKATYFFCFLTLCKQHTHIQEWAEIKQSKLGRFAPDIYDGSKL